MNKVIFTLALLFTVSCSLFTAKATNVSGGIYTNTTWTFSNSPYIVTDTIVVFPGVTLTIEPGVVVKFNDHKYIDIRQASLIANGTALDSITFTSNNASPTPGIWGGGITAGIYLNSAIRAQFRYCSICYATSGITYQGQTSDTLILKNSTLNYNVIGLNVHNTINFIDYCVFKFNTSYAIGGNGSLQDTLNYCNISNNNVGINKNDFAYIGNCTVDSNQTGFYNSSFIHVYNCIVKYNQTGIIYGASDFFYHCIIDSNYVEGIIVGGDSLINCEIKYNQGIGLEVPGSGVTTGCDIEYNVIGVQLQFPAYIQCNKICNNSTYDLKYTITTNTNAIAHNYWGTTDSTIIASHIYDGYDNINLGLLTFIPLDTTNCYLTGCNLQLTTTTSSATCGTCANGSSHVSVANGFAPYTYTWNTSPIQTTSHATGLLPGTYTVCVVDANGCTACHAVTIDSINCSTFHIAASSGNATCSTCPDGTGTVVVTGGTSPYTYSWYTTPMQSTATATGLLAGAYQVCVLDAGGCILCDSVIINTGYCSAHFNLSPDTIPHHYLATNMASGVTPITYDWDWGDASPHDFTPFPSHTYAAAGYYTICLTIHDAVGCGNMYCNSFYLLRTANTMVYVNVVNNLTTGLNNLADMNIISIYPNPATNTITIHQTAFKANQSFIITDVLGNKVYSQALNNDEETMDISNLSSGIYFYEVNGKRGKIIKE